MNRIFVTIGLILFASSFAIADDASNSENQAEGADKSANSQADVSKDQAKSLDYRKDNKAKRNKSNFGAVVSAEAKKLKDADQDTRKGMGTWVSDQRRQDDQKHPDAVANSGSASADGSSHAASAPVGSSTTGATNASGHGQADSHTH